MSGLSAIDNIIYSCISAISLIFISAVIFSIILFKKTVWKRYYIRLIFYVQASDFLATLGYSIGIQHDGTFGCYFQAFMTNHFALSSVEVVFTVVKTLCIFSRMHICTACIFGNWVLGEQSICSCGRNILLPMEQSC